MRDAECLLDQLSLLSTTITPQWIWEVAGAVPEHELLSLIEAIAANDSDIVQAKLRDLLESGKEPSVILQSITSFYRDLLIAKTSPTKHNMVALTEDTWKQLCQLASAESTSSILQAQQHLRQCEVQIKQSSQPWLWLEISILGLLSNAHSPASTTSTTATPTPDNPPWTNWKTPLDAISWAQQQLPHLSSEELQQQWNTLKPVDGKKAPIWVKTIQDLQYQK